MTAGTGRPAGGRGRIDGPDKVSGRARYAFEHSPEGVAYVWPVGASIAKGTMHSIDTRPAELVPGVLAVLSADNAPRLRPSSERELELFQSHQVAYRGQMVAAVVATSLEAAREGADLVAIDYRAVPHDVTLRADHPRLYAPEHVNPRFDTDTAKGDFGSAFAAAEVQVDQTYTTPAEHNNPMEPHATLASWDGDQLSLVDSNQGPGRTVPVLAELFGLSHDQVHVVTPYVGGAFGSKGTPRPQVVLAALAARVVGRPVKCALTRQQMFAMVGHRTPTIQRLRLGASRDGRLSAVGHDVWEQTSTLKEFAEQTAVGTRHMYAGENRRTTHRLVALDVPTPSWMRAPGEAPGIYALEAAMDELAVACGIDPLELRLRNEPAVEPESGKTFSSRHLVDCLRAGGRRFGWAGRDPNPRARQEGRWLVGTGLACSTYPARAARSQAVVSVDASGDYQVGIAAADIGTGARTMLSIVASEALEAPRERIEVRIGDSALPEAMIAGGSMGTASWSWAVIKACRALQDKVAAQHGLIPAGGLSARADTEEDLDDQGRYASYSFGAQFAEVAVDIDTGEVRVPRLFGMFAAGRIINAPLARSQFIGGMTMGLSMALMEESAMDPAFGDYPNHDLASYHIATCADVQEIEAGWIDEDERHLGPAAAKGIGEIGIVGTAAAITNAVYHATGIRVRDLPVRPDKLVR